MTRLQPGRALFAFVFFAALPMAVLGCPKKPPPVEDAAPPPPQPEAAVVDLAPITDDAGDADADEAGDADADAKKPMGQINPNQAKILACCAAIRAQARQLGPMSPEGAQLNMIAGSCEGFARQVGTGGNAPEFAALRAALGGKNVPGCAF
jgi:hypothetical protein